MSLIRKYTVHTVATLAVLLAAAGVWGPSAFTQSNVVRVSGTILSDTTWTRDPGSRYIISANPPHSAGWTVEGIWP